MKNLILVTSPPACGKTFISRKLAENVDNIVYLDKDTLIPLSNQIFKVAGEENNRSSDFFEEHVRNAEYEVVLALAMEALEYADNVLINAPFTREIRDPDYMKKLHSQVASKGANLVLIWVHTDIEVCKQRMFERNSPRDTWKLANWDEYIAGRDFDIPETINDPEMIDLLYVFKNSSDDEYKESMKEIVEILKK